MSRYLSHNEPQKMAALQRDTTAPGKGGFDPLGGVGWGCGRPCPESGSSTQIRSRPRFPGGRTPFWEGWRSPVELLARLGGRKVRPPSRTTKFVGYVEER